MSSRRRLQQLTDRDLEQLRAAYSSYRRGDILCFLYIISKYLDKMDISRAFTYVRDVFNPPSILLHRSIYYTYMILALSFIVVIPFIAASWGSGLTMFNVFIMGLACPLLYLIAVNIANRVETAFWQYLTYVMTLLLLVYAVPLVGVVPLLLYGAVFIIGLRCYYLRKPYFIIARLVVTVSREGAGKNRILNNMDHGSINECEIIRELEKHVYTICSTDSTGGSISRSHSRNEISCREHDDPS